MMIDYDISEPISQGSDGAQEAENRRIAEIADELRRPLSTPSLRV